MPIVRYSEVVTLNPLGQAFLAQSPQLAKQMAIAGDMERVYEIAPGELGDPLLQCAQLTRASLPC